MSESRWEIWLDDPRGNRIALLSKTVLEFSFTRVLNGVGGFSVKLPADFDVSLLVLDGIIEFWRAPKNSAMNWVGMGFIRRWEYEGFGPTTVTISGPDAMDLLDRRIIAYAAGSAYSVKDDYLDDMMKEIVDENLGASCTDTNRDLSGLGLSVAADLSAAPQAAASFGWANLLETLQRLAEASRQAGRDANNQATELYFDLIPALISSTQIGFTFITSTTQLGKDHTSPDGQAPIVFGPEWANLENPVLVFDHTNEVNYVYSGGPDNGANREIVEVDDDFRIGVSVWNRRENFVDAKDEESTSGVTALGNEELGTGRPRIYFSGDLLDTNSSRYGIDWEFGDRVSAAYLGREFDGMIRAVSFRMDNSGKETITARLEAEEV